MSAAKRAVIPPTQVTQINAVEALGGTASAG
jgi:hypothetical protein